MLIKKYGAINQIVFDNTVYRNGECRIYPSVSSMLNILEMIIDAKATTESLVLIPYYRNKRKNQQVEFDKMTFCIECRNNVTEEQEMLFLESCCEEGEKINEDIRKRNFLCDFNDVKGFSKAICTYINYLDTLIPKITKILLEEYDFTVNELLYGHICFSIESA